MTELALIPANDSPIDRRWGAGFELLLRMAVIAERGHTTGIDVSELRRLIDYRQMTQIEIADLGTVSPFHAVAQKIAQDPETAPKHADAMKDAINRVVESEGFAPVFAIGRQA